MERFPLPPPSCVTCSPDVWESFLLYYEGDLHYHDLPLTTIELQELLSWEEDCLRLLDEENAILNEQSA